MPDFTYETFYHCQTAEFWSTEIEGSKGNKYTVTWQEGGYYHGYETCTHNYSCTCPAFKFNKQPCKHIKQAEKLHCKWLQFIDGEEPKMIDNKPHCPKCSQPAKTQRWAV